MKKKKFISPSMTFFPNNMTIFVPGADSPLTIIIKYQNELNH